MNYRSHDGKRTLLQGPQSDQELMEKILMKWTSPHQWQPCCEEHVIFVADDQVFHLDHKAMSCVVQYLERNHPHMPDLGLVRSMLASIKPPAPKPEPEVAVRLYPAPVREPEAISTFEPEPEPRWKVRIRTKMERGGTIESVQLLEELRDLIDLIEDGPYASSTKHIKIKLEYIQP